MKMNVLSKSIGYVVFDLYAQNVVIDETIKLSFIPYDALG